MIISCPDCKTKYEVDAAQVPLAGRRMRCANCGEVWRVYPKSPQDVAKSETMPENKANDEAKKQHTKQKSSFFSALLKMVLILAVLLALVFAYFFRYSIVREFPDSEVIYNKLGLEAKVVGDGLFFENISWTEYEDSDVRKMDVTGMIGNKTDNILSVPLLHIELLDADRHVLQNVDSTISAEYVGGNEKIAFKTTIVRPAPFVRYIFITFK